SSMSSTRCMLTVKPLARSLTNSRAQHWSVPFFHARTQQMATAAAGETAAKMVAIQVADVGGPEKLTLAVDVPLPVPGEHMVLVRNKIAGVNFIDTYHRSGLYPISGSPFTPGVEGAGEVVAVGPGVQGLQPGVQVSYITRPPGGSYAQYTAVHDSKIARIPEGISHEVAAASMIQGMTAHCLVHQAYPVQRGDWVLVTAAAGGTGRLIAQLAAAAGATVIGTASTPDKAEVARQAGCAHVVLYEQQQDLAAEVMRLTAGRGVQAVYDGVGRATFDAALSCVARLGYMISFGNASGKVPDLDILRLTRNNVRLMRPALWDFITTKEEFESVSSQTLAAVAEGKLKVLVGGRYLLSAAAQAHRDLEGRATTGKLVLQVP
ncbi:hypothetical protein Agub_g9375, partial [Astrephomene gubernaculifera]